MSEKQNAKHAVGSAAQRAKHHPYPERDDQYVEHPDDHQSDAEWLHDLKKKWKQIKMPFQRKYGIDPDHPELQHDFKKSLKYLSDRTGLTKTELRNQINKW